MGEQATDFRSQSVLLSSLSAEDGTALLSRAHWVSFDRGQTIFGCDEPGDTMLLVAEGRIEISITSLSGRKSVLNYMGPGEVLGEIAVLDGGPRSADAVAASDVRGLVLHRRDVLAFLQSRPAALFALVTELCAKVRNASEMFATQAQTEAPSRLARALLRLAERWGEQRPGGVLLPSAMFSQTDLGEFSGLARENVNRRLRAWASAGLVQITAEGIVLRDAAALREVADL
jgi:CRP/FNR family transcriptional regulator, cyclic AMP receptor protein